MKCPHCTVNIHEAWHIQQVGNNIGWHTRFMSCPACSEYILEAHGPPQGSSWFLFHPKGSSRGPVSADVPREIAEDYNQSALVLNDSPKASAALSRRCLQAILREAGYQQKDLAKQVDAVLVEQDARKALPTGPYSTLDAVRNFGNFSAHHINDMTTLQVIDVEDHEAEYCLDILDALFDHYYVRPAEAKLRRAALDAKLANAGKPPAK